MSQGQMDLFFFFCKQENAKEIEKNENVFLVHLRPHESPIETNPATHCRISNFRASSVDIQFDYS